MKKTNKKGFTIVELVIVIAVIAILSAVLIPTFGGIISQANESAAKQECRNKYTEVYAQDIADGVLDCKTNSGKANEAAITVTNGNYEVVSAGVVKVTLTNSHGYTVTFDGTNYTVTAVTP